MSFKVDVLKNFAKEPLFNKVAGLKACNFIKNRLQREIYEIFRTFFYKTRPVAGSGEGLSNSILPAFNSCLNRWKDSLDQTVAVAPLSQDVLSDTIAIQNIYFTSSLNGSPSA